ncbi:MAG: DNA-binding protein [Bryobacterales bacterium]|nr:DNA-binding protein [Bryobacterales bacterium]
MRRLGLIGLLLIRFSPLGGVAGAQTASTPPKVFGGAQVQEIYRVRLDRGDLLLESIMEAIKKHGIQDGAVLTAAGSLQECTFHRVKSLAAKPEQEFMTVKEAMEIIGVNGIIAAGEPHLHMTLSNGKGAFGGHLENGCKVLYRAELTIAKFSGVKLARTPNAEGVPVLQEVKAAKK